MNNFRFRTPITVRERVRRLDNFDFGKRKDHASAARQELRLAPQNALAEMPGEDEKIVGLHGACLGFGDDGNAGPRRKRAEFVLVHFGNAGHELRSDPAELQHHVARGRGAVADDVLSVRRRATAARPPPKNGTQGVAFVVDGNDDGQQPSLS